MGENNNYYQSVSSYLEFDETVRNPAAKIDNTSPIRLLFNPYAHCFKQPSLAISGGMEIERIKFLGQNSTIMRCSTSKECDLLTHFDDNNEGKTAADFNSTFFKHLLFENHTVEANKGEIQGQLLLEHIFGFCKTFKKFTKNLGFHLTLKTTDLQNFFLTTIATDTNVTLNSCYLFVPILIPNTETQLMFNENIKNKYTITYDSWYTERKLSSDGNELQVDIGSAQHVNSPKYLIASFETANSIAAPIKLEKVAIFDNVIVRRCFCEIDVYRYPKDAVLSKFPEKV